ncbi:Gfo/Idh/MocA family protein [Candidatus Latescibacterota bacterium]
MAVRAGHSHSIRCGVIGVGVHGLHHVRLLSSSESAVFTAIYDTDRDISNRVAEDYGVTAYTSLEELLEQVDCVTVAVPTTEHYKVVRTCFSMGKSVLVEKPIATTVYEADRMIGEAKERGFILAVGHIERFNSAYRSAAANNISPLFIESHRLAVFNPRGTDVAVVLDLMIHDIDIVLDMVQRPVVSVSASGVAVVSDEVDIANARLEFEGGCVANLTASRISQKKMRKIRTFQKNSYISMDFLAGESEVFSLNPDENPIADAGTPPQLIEGISYSKFPNDGLNALELEIADFINAVESGSEPQVTGSDGRKALETASMVMESIESSMRRFE